MTYEIITASSIDELKQKVEDFKAANVLFVEKGGAGKANANTYMQTLAEST